MAISKSEQHFDAVLALVEGGMTVHAACQSQPEFPDSSSFLKFCKASDGRRQRLVEAETAREKAFFDVVEKVVSAVENGATITDASAKHCVTPKFVRKRVLSSPELTSRLTAATKRKPGAKFGRVSRPNDSFTEEEYRATLDRIAKGTDPVLMQMVAGEGEVPYGAIQRRVASDPAFARLYHAAIAKRATVTIRRYSADGVDASDWLYGEVKKHPLYRKARALLRVGNSEDAQDMCMDVIVAMLESREVDRDEVVTEHFRKTQSHCRSLDSTIFASDRRQENLHEFVADRIEVHSW